MRHTEKAQVPASEVLAAIRDYESYPKFVEGVKSIRTERITENSSRVFYDLELGKRIQYSCLHKEGEGSNSWTLEDGGGFLKKNEGTWTVTSTGPSSCEVAYDLEIEFSGFVPSFMINPLIRRSLPALVQGMIAQAGRRSSPHR